MPAFQAGDARFKPGRGRHFLPSDMSSQSPCKMLCADAPAGVLCRPYHLLFQILQGRVLSMGNIDVRKVVGTGVKFLLISLLVGWVLSVINVDALGFIRFLSQSVRHAGELAADAVRWGVPYILLGAVVVVPFYIIKFGFDLLKRRRK